ncbi:MAG: sigma-70 family RNA polymerase sigma factor [Oscillospiraceae bacterium]|nr:sigma-70 family RNA polymerase sigma factor [Oscillospiraceae bacterium]
MKFQSQCSDEKLCALAVDGDRIAEEHLAARYSRLVRICARPYFLAGGDSEDLIQEGMIGLLSAIRGFQPDRGSTFRTYAEICIRHRLYSAVKSAAGGKHSPLNQSVSIDSSLFEEVSSSYSYGERSLPAGDPEDMLISREDREIQLKGLREKLSGYEKIILDFYLDGLSCQEIAQKTGKTFKSVDNAVQRIRRKAAPFLTSGGISVS